MPETHLRPYLLPARVRRGLVLAGLTVCLAACGSTPAATTVITAAGATGAPADPTGQVCCAPVAGAGDVVNGVATVHNGWDLAFVNFMALHDAVAAEMGDLAPTRASSQRVKDMAAAISAPQGPRFQRMSAMATAWDEPVPPTDPEAAGSVHDHGGGLPDASYGTAETLARLTGTAFDRQFLTTLIAHHRSTMPVARATIDSGENPQTRALTVELVAEQTAQITRMQQLLDAL